MKREEVIAALGALAQESRLDIFRILVQKGPAGLPAGDIGRKLGLPAPTLSFHLGQLRHAGLLSAHRNSRSIAYAADYRTMNALLKFLTENCCGGNLEACAPEAACAPSNGNSASKRKSRRAPRKKKSHSKSLEVAR
jgi:ArsR family transcriptional regulator, arsenate/arsenite/antimonite-responsive transcriptional repressor